VALDAWADAHSITLSFSRPGKPVDNCFVESVHDMLRDACLILHWFLTLAEAGEVIDAWRVEYNACRPHQSLGNRTPSEWADELRAHEPDGARESLEPGPAQLTRWPRSGAQLGA
jgi:putative transposase